MTGFDIWGYIGQAMPGWWQWATTNKIYACMMVFFVGNMLEAHVSISYTYLPKAIQLQPPVIAVIKPILFVCSWSRRAPLRFSSTTFLYGRNYSPGEYLHQLNYSKSLTINSSFRSRWTWTRISWSKWIWRERERKGIDIRRTHSLSPPNRPCNAIEIYKFICCTHWPTHSQARGIYIQLNLEGSQMAVLGSENTSFIDSLANDWRTDQSFTSEIHKIMWI